MCIRLSKERGVLKRRCFTATHYDIGQRTFFGDQTEFLADVARSGWVSYSPHMYMWTVKTFLDVRRVSIKGYHSQAPRMGLGSRVSRRECGVFVCTCCCQSTGVGF